MEFTVYTTSSCPYCVRAKSLLASKGLKFEEISVADPEARARLSAKSGMRTVPVIYLGDRLIGGYTDLAALNESGELDKLVHRTLH